MMAVCRLALLLLSEEMIIINISRNPCTNYPLGHPRVNNHILKTIRQMRSPDA